MNFASFLLFFLRFLWYVYLGYFAQFYSLIGPPSCWSNVGVGLCAFLCLGSLADGPATASGFTCCRPICVKNRSTLLPSCVAIRLPPVTWGGMPGWPLCWILSMLFISMPNRFPSAELSPPISMWVCPIVFQGGASFREVGSLFFLWPLTCSPFFFCKFGQTPKRQSPSKLGLQPMPKPPVRAHRIKFFPVCYRTPLKLNFQKSCACLGFFPCDFEES